MIIKKRDLISIKSNLTSQLNTDAQDSTKLNNTIETFKTTLSSVTNFEGEMFDKIIAKLETYKIAIMKRIELSTELSNKINDTLSTLIEAMGSDEEIDTSKREELEKKYQHYRELIDGLNSSLNEYQTKYKETNLTTYRNQISGITRDIVYYRESADYIKLQINKIDTIEALDGTQCGQLSSLDELVANYTKITSEIEASRSSIAVTTLGVMI